LKSRARDVKEMIRYTSINSLKVLNDAIHKSTFLSTRINMAYTQCSV